MSERIPFRFAPIPHDLLFNHDVPPQVIVLWAAIYRLADLGGGVAAIGQVDLGKELGWSDDTVARWAKKGGGLGWIVVRRRGQGFPNEYRTAIPDSAELRDQEPAQTRQTSADLRDLSSISETSRDSYARSRSLPRGNDFLAWYTAYPKHVARGDAEKAWKTLASELPSIETLILATKNYANSREVERGFVKLPATWLRAKCWLDEHEAQQAVSEW